jgi:F0F1-type ATP synthase assembly protein I
MSDHDSNGPDEAIEARLRKLLGETPQDLSGHFGGTLEEVDKHAQELPSTDDFDDRLRSLEEKAALLRGKQESKKQKESVRIASDQEQAQGIGLGIQIGYVIIGLPLAGVLFGVAADYFLKSNLFKGIGALVGAVVGVIIAIHMTNENAKNI